MIRKVIRLAKRDRSKRIWFIPKRSNVHQMIALIHGIIKRNYDGTTWNAQKQDNLNLELKNLGATRSGKKIAPQGMRTLLASINYLGFTYLDNTTNPTTIRITEAGYKFYDRHKDDLEPIESLSKGETIDESVSVKDQMIKLQITNPTILEYCEDLYVFPFRAVLAMLKELEFLTKEEIAMYVFHTYDMTHLNYKMQEIKNFRRLKKEEQESLIDTYSKTSEGNLTLVQAPSSTYFMSFCTATGYIDKYLHKMKSGRKTLSIRIRDNCEDVIDNILELYEDTETYDFEDNLKLWIAYIGKPERLYAPTLLLINNESSTEVYIELHHEKDGIIETEILNQESFINIPTFLNEKYELSVFSIDENIQIYESKFSAKKNQKIILRDSIFGKKDYKSFDKMNNGELVNELLEHSNSRNFTNKMLQKLRILKTRLGIDKTTDSALRGAQYEYLFFLFLNNLKNKSYIDDIIWNGKIGKYNLPVQAPGGKTGQADIIFIIENIHYVLELTTIKSKTGQQTAEIIPVPDHIKLYRNNMPKNINVKGIFCAPIIHQRNHAIMKTVLTNEDVPFASITDKDLLELFNVKSRQEIKDRLLGLFS